eukprot:1159170-Amorphochlora_amoeboformis.AAC.1
MYRLTPARRQDTRVRHPRHQWSRSKGSGGYHVAVLGYLGIGDEIGDVIVVATSASVISVEVTPNGSTGPVEGGETIWRRARPWHVIAVVGAVVGEVIRDVIVVATWASVIDRGCDVVGDVIGEAIVCSKVPGHRVGSHPDWLVDLLPANVQ